MLCRSYRRMATLLFALTLPLILSLVGLWEFVFEPMVHGPENLPDTLEHFATSAFFSTLALAFASGVVFYLGAGMDRERHAREKMTAALERAQRIGQVGSWEWRLSTKTVRLSGEALAIAGLDPDRPIVDEQFLMTMLPEGLRERYREKMGNLVTLHDHFDLIHTIVRPDGAIRHIHTRGESLTDRDDPTRIIGASGTIHDITDRVMAEERMRLHAAVFTHSSEAIMVTDADGIIADVNPAFSSLTGYRAEEVIGRSPNILNSGEHPRKFYADMWGEILSKGSWNGEIRNRVKEGGVVPMELFISAIPDEQGRPTRFVSIFSDITDRKEREENLRRLSVTDPLTGVSNRRAFDETLSLEWRRGMRNSTPITLLMIDLDHFKAFNDTYGHQEGDRCLKTVADMIGQLIRRPGDMVARYGGEEFAVILPETNQGGGFLMAESMLAALFDNDDLPRQGDRKLTASIGIASVTPRKGDSPASLIRRADEALYRAKAAGRNRAELADMIDHPSN